jgi:DNA (cytosine-5)-methyltransferase 1
MTYGSICSGIEAATVAWHPLGWRPAWFAEIDPFCRALLKYHYPEVKNHGDLTRLASGGGADAVDLLVGGTPCQDFSVAGLRAGLDGTHGNLTLEYLKLAQRLRPRWLVWENVPGVLSIDRGRTFGTFLGGLAELGYGFAYRVFDAQYFGVPQRRRRVFVVGYLGDWRVAAAVLFERESMSGHPPPRRKAGKGFTHDVVSCLTSSGREVERTGETRAQDPVVEILAFGGNNTSGPIDVSTACRAKGGSGHGDFESETFVTTPVALRGHGDYGDGLPCLRNSGGDCAGGSEALVAHSLRGEGFDASEDGTGRGIPLVAATLQANSGRNQVESQYIPILEVGARTGKSTNDRACGSGIGKPGDPMYTLQSGKQHGIAVSLRGRDGGATAELGDDISNALRASTGGGDKAHVLAFHENQRHELSVSETAGALKTGGGKPGQGYPALLSHSAVRRLTPRECERLQGFPDDYTLIPHRGKPAADGPRYKALGNSMAVPVMHWIGKRIEMVDSFISRGRYVGASP